MQIEIYDFNLEATLDSGQVFGFVKLNEKIYEGLLYGYPVKLWQTANTFHIESKIPKSKIIEYFDLERDLRPIYRIMEEDPKLALIPTKLKGLRLIQQDHWEALACFIISSNNNVKRIQHIWKNLSKLSNSKQSFPRAHEIARVHERTLRELGLGYRAPFLSRTAQFISKNDLALDAIHEADYDEARQRVMQFPGIGPKVADCVLLYGFQKYEAFPVDVWILRVMRKLYFKNRKVSEEKIRQFGMRRWGLNAGYIQQYLFHGARTGMI